LLHGDTKNLRAKTVRWYGERSSVFIRWAEARGVTQLTDVKPQTVQEYLQYLRHSHVSGIGPKGRKGQAPKGDRRLADTTVRGAYNVLQVWFRWAAREDRLQSDPMLGVEKPKVPKGQIRAATRTDVRQLAQVARRHEGFEGVRNETIVKLAFATGLRLSEVAGLSLKDIDWSTSSLRVVGKGNKERRVYFGRKTRRTLQSYVNNSRAAVVRRFSDRDDEVLFLTVHGRPMSPSGITTAFRRLRNQAGIRAPFHGLRHGFAAESTRMGADPFYLQEQLGHASLDMVRHYVRQFGPDRQRKASRFDLSDLLE
jgi:site-specific recombinase XerD